ncbi:MAG: peptidoglycan DD-metalloendopeptidase family protein [Gammaproteobacteria bacterium]|nr:peptidoglycan DD-metalloendopeptidase family protein [Gammaproteobacteria bacterium]
MDPKQFLTQIVQTFKQFVLKYYPKEHLYIAGSMAALFLLLLIIPGEDKGPAVPNQTTRIPIPVTLDAPGSEPSSSLNLADYVVTAEAPAEINLWQNVEIKSGDNLSAIFTKVGLSDQDLFRVLNSSEEAKILNRVYPGYQLDFLIPDEGELEQLRVLKSPLEGYLFTRENNDYLVQEIIKEAQIHQAFKVGEISDSLFMAGQREQIPAVHLMEMANIFGGVIDFILDPRMGDQFSILYNEQFLDGQFIGNGEILATRFVNQGRVFTAVRYINEEGEVGYYSPDGESMRKAFLRNPLDVFRISSNFNPRRRHPILNTIRAHKGTDYAAPTGTPIRATSDGRVTRASRYGSFGNLVIIQHAGGFETKYAHLSRFANGIGRGDRVRQGEVIGYVGSTGGATGPHLHYEFLVNGVHQNPRTILDKLPTAVSIEAAEMDRFRDQIAPLLRQFEELNDSRLLSLNQQSAD